MNCELIWFKYIQLLYIFQFWKKEAPWRSRWKAVSLSLWWTRWSSSACLFSICRKTPFRRWRTIHWIRWESHRLVVESPTVNWTALHSCSWDWSCLRSKALRRSGSCHVAFSQEWHASTTPGWHWRDSLIIWYVRKKKNVHLSLVVSLNPQLQ